MEESDVNYCELTSDQKKKFDECFDTCLKPEERKMKSNFAKCMGYDSMAEYFDYVCTLETMDEVKEVREKCENEIGEDFETNVPQKDIKRCYDDAKSA